MANPVDFEGANFIMAAPEGQEHTVIDLPVFRHDHGMVFAALLDEEERAKVAETGVVWVQIMGHAMPPVAIAGISPVEMTDPDGTKREPLVHTKLPIQNRKASHDQN